MKLREYKSLSRKRAKSEKAREKLNSKFQARQQKNIKKWASEGCY